MSRFQTTADILTQARRFHLNLRQYYQHLCDHQEHEQIRQLLTYLMAHEQRLADAIELFTESAPEGVLTTWFDGAPELDEVAACREHFSASGGEGQLGRLVSSALRLDHYLLERYQALAEQCEAEQVREVFRNLAALEQLQERNLVIASNGLWDS